MLPSDLGHCLRALRFEALGQSIPDPVDRENLVVDGALGDSWHWQFRLSERIDKRGELPLESVLLEVAGAELLLSWAILRWLLIDLGSSPRPLLARLCLALSGRIRIRVIVEVAHVDLWQLL